MTNGAVTAAEIELHLEHLTYGDLRRLRKAQGQPDAEDVFDELIAKVVPGGIDDLPFQEARALIDRLTAAIQDAMGGKMQPAGPSSAGSGMAPPVTPVTSR